MADIQIEKYVSGDVQLIVEFEVDIDGCVINVLVGSFGVEEDSSVVGRRGGGGSGEGGSGGGRVGAAAALVVLVAGR